MQFLINERSFIGQAKNNAEADELMKIMYLIIQEIKPVQGNKPLQTYSNFSLQQLINGINVHQWLYQALKSGNQNQKTIAKFLIQIISKGPFIDLQDDFQNISTSHKCYLNKQDFSESSLLGVCHLQGKLISLQNAPDFTPEYLALEFGMNEDSLETVTIHNLTTIEQAKKIRPIYQFNPKHHPQAKGTSQKPHTAMDLSDDEAQKVLDNSLESSNKNSNKRYGYQREKDQFYVFHSDNTSNEEGYPTYHGYPIDENQFSDAIQKKLLE